MRVAKHYLLPSPFSTWWPCDRLTFALAAAWLPGRSNTSVATSTCFLRGVPGPPGPAMVGLQVDSQECLVENG